MRLLLLILLFFSSPGGAQPKADIEIRNAWSRATPSGAEVGAGYLEIRNRGAKADRLLSASTDIAKRVELHVTQRAGDVARMRQVQSVEIPAGKSVVLKPGAGHLMLVELARPLKEGERFALKLRFERAGEMQAEVEVRALGTSGHHH